MSTIATRVIYPALHTNARTEWRLSGAAAFRNLRLSGVGCVTTGGNGAYLDNCGVLGLISNCYLMNGGDVLDMLQEGHQWLAFQQLRRGESGRDNGLDHSLYMPLRGSSTSYQVSLGDCKTINKVSAGSRFASADKSSFMGWVHCNALFSLLASLPYLPCDAWPNLRLVIEWRSAPSSAIFAGNTAGVDIAGIVPAMLLADALDASDLAAAGPLPPAVVYNRFELERVVLPGGAQPGGGVVTVVDTPLRLVAAMGKIVNRICLINVPGDGAASVAQTDRLKADCSEALEGEVVQVTVNGEALCPYVGIDSASRKQAMLYQAWGTVNTVQGGHIQAYSPTDNVNKLAGLFDPQDGGTSVAYQSYGGLSIQRRVSEMHIAHRRSLTNLRFGATLLSVVYEVPYVISFGKPSGSYSVAFA